MPELYIIIARKIFFRILEGHVPPSPPDLPSPTPVTDGEREEGNDRIKMSARSAVLLPV